MLHQVKALPYGTQYQALLADGSLVDTTLTIAGLALTPEDIVEVRWSAEAEGVHMSVRPEGSRGSGAGQHTESGNSKAQGSTRSSAVDTSAVPHTASAPPFTSASAPSVAAAVSNAASAPLMAAAVPTAAASVPRAAQPVPAAVDTGKLCIVLCLRLAIAGSWQGRIGPCSGQYHKQFLMHGNVMQVKVCMLLCVAGWVACFCLPRPSCRVYLRVA